MNYEIYIRHICYLKLCCVFTETLMESASEYQNINISIRRYVTSEDQTCATLKSDEQNLRSTYSDSDQDPNHVISTQKRQNKLKPTHSDLNQAEHSEVSTVLHSRQINYQRLYSKTKIFSKWKERNEH